jgi:hypothetical protein
VNGKRIRVAPLTHGAKLRLGNSYGRFSEELPTETDAPQTPDAYERPAAAAAAGAELDALPTAQHQAIRADTLPQPADDLKKK